MNSRRHIDVISIANALEAKHKGLAAAMPGFHAFTGIKLNNVVNYIDFETPLGVLAGLVQRTICLVFPFLYIVRYTCSLNKLTFMQYF